MEFSMALLCIMHEMKSYPFEWEIYHMCKLAICIKYEDAQNKTTLDEMSDEFNGWTFTYYNMDEIKLPKSHWS